jgi:membrane protein implicated in regulation of membrane protease activity
MRRGWKGVGALLIAVAALVALAVAIRSFFLIVVGAAAVAVAILHFWNKRPVKTPEDDQIRLNLDK